MSYIPKFGLYPKNMELYPKIWVISQHVGYIPKFGLYPKIVLYPKKWWLYPQKSSLYPTKSGISYPKRIGIHLYPKNVVYIPKLVFCLGVDMAVPKKAPHEFSPAGCGTLLKAWPEKKHGVWELTMDPIHEKFAIKNGS